MLCGIKQLLCRRLLHQLALVHYGDSIGEIRHDSHVVSDQDDRGAELVAAATQQIQDFCLHRDVEGCRRFIRNDQLGF